MVLRSFRSNVNSSDMVIMPDELTYSLISATAAYLPKSVQTLLANPQQKPFALILKSIYKTMSNTVAGLNNTLKTKPNKA